MDGNLYRFGDEFAEPLYERSSPDKVHSPVHYVGNDFRRSCFEYFLYRFNEVVD